MGNKIWILFLILTISFYIYSSNNMLEILFHFTMTDREPAGVEAICPVLVLQSFPSHLTLSSAVKVSLPLQPVSLLVMGTSVCIQASK